MRAYILQETYRKANQCYQEICVEKRAYFKKATKTLCASLLQHAKGSPAPYPRFRLYSNPLAWSKPKAKLRFWTQAPLAPFPKLSSLAMSHTVPLVSFAKQKISRLLVLFKVSGRMNAPRSSASVGFRGATEMKRDPA